MLLTKRNEYALLAMILLAGNKKDRPLPASGLAQKLRTTPAFMSKIAQQLAAAGLVTSRRGKGGGLMLVRQPERILVRDVFLAVDGTLLLSQCMCQGRCRHLACPLYPVLRKVQQELDAGMNSARLSSFVKTTKANPSRRGEKEQRRSRDTKGR